jgi:hypothetical protein
MTEKVVTYEPDKRLDELDERFPLHQELKVKINLGRTRSSESTSESRRASE